MKWRTVGFMALLVGLSFTHPQQTQARELMISGTGMALATMREVVKAYAAQAPDSKITVLPSMGSGGGLKALNDGVLGLSISARGLKPKELEEGLQEEFCFQTALILATQPEYAANIHLVDLPALYSDVAPQWPDGTPLKVILRALSGSEMPYLAKRVPGLEEAFVIARSRTETPVGITDQLNADIAENLSGALAITSLMQITSEKRDLVPMSVNGIMPSPATLKDGSYPFALRICVVGKRDQSGEDAASLVRFMKSTEGRAIFETIGALPDTTSD